MSGESQSPGQEPPPVPASPARPAAAAGSIQLFSFAGIDVYVSWMWLIVFYYVYSGAEHHYDSPVWGGIQCLGLFGIVILHEFGHAFACRQAGGKANYIVLWLMGGAAYVRPPQRAGATLWTTAGGPLVNLVLWPVLWYFSHWGIKQPWAVQAPDLLRCTEQLAELNLALLILNMMPVYPLDGGQILRSFLWFFIGPAYSLMAAAIIGFAAAVPATLYVIDHRFLRIPHTEYGLAQPWSYLLVFYIVMRSAAAFKQAQAMMKLQAMRRVEGMACPSCGEKPFAEDLWACEQCQARFNPFVTGGVCPGCGHAHEKIACPFCRERNEIGRWRR